MSVGEISPIIRLCSCIGMTPNPLRRTLSRESARLQALFGGSRGPSGGPPFSARKTALGDRPGLSLGIRRTRTDARKSTRRTVRFKEGRGRRSVGGKPSGEFLSNSSIWYSNPSGEVLDRLAWFFYFFSPVDRHTLTRRIPWTSTKFSEIALKN